MHDSKAEKGSVKDIYSTDFSGYLPTALKRDPKIKALAETIEKQLLKVSGNIDNVLIYSRIDELPEELVDVIAYDMHVDWYDYSLPLDTKRGILKSSVKVHKKMGTKYAVETALNELYKGIKVKEWFEYGGEPYRFRILVHIGDNGLTENTSRQIAETVRFYKNLRSHCDGVFYRLSVEKADVKIQSCMRFGMYLKVKAFLKEDIKAAGKTLLLCGMTEKIEMKIKPELRQFIKNERSAALTVLAAQRIENTMTIKKGEVR